MKVAVIGLGYVGLVTAVTLAEKGNQVICHDVNAAKMDMVCAGKSPMEEPGLEEVLQKNLGSGALTTVDDVNAAVAQSELVFLCVGTPSKEDGSIDLTAIVTAAVDVGKAIANVGTKPIIVVKSTVVPGTTDSAIRPALEKASGKSCGSGFGLCVNPEFLREGSALEDSLRPDRIVIGLVGDDGSEEAMAGLYESFHCVKLYVGSRTAEMIKYASNSMLATKISFANEIANICDLLGIDVDEVMEGVGLDNRISDKFLKAGLGFGGSCFPKDVSALAALAKAEGYEPLLLKSVLDINRDQPLRALEILRKEAGSVRGKRIAVLGLAFKPGTDDMRESRAVPIIRKLLDEGAEIIAHDPLAMENARNIFPQAEYAASAVEALEGADACIIQTDDPAYANIEDGAFLNLKLKLIIDGRRLLAHRKGELEAAGLTYRAIGMPR
jgi:UDPglucose 6-dehydrogenase